MAKDKLVNKIANSSLVTLDMEKLLQQSNWSYLDIKPFLFKEMVLMEKPFRASLKEFDWSKYAGKWVALYCSTDALIPHWGYMLLSSYLQEVDAKVFFATGNNVEDEKLLLKSLVNYLDIEKYKDQRVVVKGCGNLDLNASFYIELTQRLRPVVKSLMYGEPCSTVPIYKSKK